MQDVQHVIKFEEDSTDVSVLRVEIPSLEWGLPAEVADALKERGLTIADFGQIDTSGDKLAMTLYVQ